MTSREEAFYKKFTRLSQKQIEVSEEDQEYAVDVASKMWKQKPEVGQIAQILERAEYHPQIIEIVTVACRTFEILDRSFGK